LPARDLEELMHRFEESADWTYTVAWIDCLARGARLGRGLLIRGEHALVRELDTARRRADPLQPPRGRPAAVPFHLPGATLNRYTVRAFNALYGRLQAGAGGDRIIDYNPFFYPLDAILHWNRIYGRRGFVQYQFVLPPAAGVGGVAAILERIAARGWGSFLAVLKLFGPQDGLLSFPMEGYTLALDFPMRDGLLPFLDELDELVGAAGGRLYLAKDARMQPALLDSGYPHRDRFLEIVRRWDPDARFCSGLSDRLHLTPAPEMT
jgi:FAD/FMN-containing dehydrogenase